MGSVQLETTRAIKYLILLISAGTLARSNAPPSITYTCNDVGVQSVNNELYKHFWIMSGINGSREYCRPSNASFLTSCPNGKNQNPLVLRYEESTKNTSVGGGKRTYFYKLSCKDEASSLFTIAPGRIHPTAHDFQMHLMKGATKVTTDTPIHIGDLLKLQMIGTGVVIEPMSCFAYPKGNSNEKVPLWEFAKNITCKNQDPTKVGNMKWSHVATKQSDIEIDLYAFRLRENAEVVIECKARVCPSSGKNVTECKQTCVNTQQVTTTAESTSSTTILIPIQIGRRKRRSVSSIEKNNSGRIESSTVSFAVIVKQSVLQ